MEDNRFSLFEGLIASAGKSIRRLKASRMDAFSLSAAHTDCLSSLASAPEGLTQTQLARSLGMDRAQISRVLRDLCARAYVRAEGPGYKSRYRLTEEGRSVAGEIARVVSQVIAYVSGDIPAREIESFYRTFKIIAGRLGEAVSLYGAPRRPGREQPL